jgi:5-oxoprolinase (ATP-hydrolysing)
VTDANLLLGRLIPDYFPKIFGKSENEALDVVASQTAFEGLARKINETQERPFDLDEIVYGWVPELENTVNVRVLTSATVLSRLRMRPCVVRFVP